MCINENNYNTNAIAFGWIWYRKTEKQYRYLFDMKIIGMRISHKKTRYALNVLHIYINIYKRVNMFRKKYSIYSKPC